MQLFYSGAFDNGRAQPDASLSLGGFISGSPIANSSIANIFPDITSNLVAKNLPDVRLIVLTNTTGVDVGGVTIYTNRGTYATLKIAAVAPAIDSCSRKVFEKILSGNSLPFQASLATHEGSGSAIAVGTILAGASIGIWIERDLDLTQFTSLDGLPTVAPFDPFNKQPDGSCATLVAQLQAIQNPDTPVYEQEQLVITWS